MPRASSLALRVPIALLPSALSEELSGGPPSEPSSGLIELSGEMQGLNVRSKPRELDRECTGIAGLHRAPAARSSSAAASVRAVPRKTTADAAGCMRQSSPESAAASGTDPGRVSLGAAPAPAPMQEQASAVQRVGCRRGPSQPGTHAASWDATHAQLQSPASVSSQGWMSACGSSVLGVSVSLLPGAAAAAAAGAQTAAAITEQLPEDRRSSLCASSIGENSRSSVLAGSSADGEGSGHWADSPGSSLAGVGPGSGSAGPVSPLAATAQQAPHQAQVAQQPTAARHATAKRATAGLQPASRTLAKSRRPVSAGTLCSQPSSVAPSSRPGSASPKKRPAR